MKRAVQSAMRLGAQGIRINCSGRLGGAGDRGMEWYREGPRAAAHAARRRRFRLCRANTLRHCGSSGYFKGEILAHDPMAQDKRAAERSRPGRPPAAPGAA